MTDTVRRDLLVLVADKNTESTILSLLARHHALGIREVRLDVFVHPERDPACLKKSHTFLQAQSDNYQHALVIFDREGSGQEEVAAEVLEAQVETALRRHGWGDRAAAIVLDPELEVWVWSDSPEVDRVLGWSDRSPNLRTWLKTSDAFWTSTPSHAESDRSGKPDRPKEAMEQALRIVRRPRSSTYYAQLAGCVSVNRCTDRGFMKLRHCLSLWFASTSYRVCGFS